MRLLLILFTLLSLTSCSKRKIDLLVFNATIYTVDSAFSTAEAMAVNEGKIIDLGDYPILKEKYNAKKNLDAHGKVILPGLIDAHAHFAGYGQSLERINLFGTKSWDEVVVLTKKFADNHDNEWILGRGWDQNTWKDKVFPTNDELNKLFPDRPVLLTRVDAHAAIANDKALSLAGININTKLNGGEILKQGGKLTGVLIDNAVDLVHKVIPSETSEQICKQLLSAQKNCFSVGLTTIDDCGLDFEVVNLIDSLQKSGNLKMRLYVMLSDLPKNYDYLFKKGKIKTERLNVRSFKVFSDGALGSRGACLLHPYADKKDWTGFLLSSKEHFDSVANIIYNHGFQMCTHAIGDSSNRVILKIYAKYLKGKNDLRWRIEHAQVVDKADFHMFKDYNIIPSVQPTHATSDMYWAEKRLGKERIQNAYANETLLEQNGWLPLGTDFPVEDISPFKTFYAATARQDASGWPEGGFQPENALSREDALRGMTIWAAKSNFEEAEKGSLEKGKLADFIIIDRDLIKVGKKEILGTKVLKTYVNGEKVFDAMDK
ncbi:MAG: amidohydrolase [Saprospiraceae bacterium]|nr:amidohydrolase [Saprospiraceae bacterium]